MYTKICIQCNSKYTKKKTNKNRDFNKSRFCSRLCYYTYNKNKPKIVKQLKCIQCTKLFTPKRKTHLCCSRQCSGRIKYKNLIKSPNYSKFIRYCGLSGKFKHELTSCQIRAHARHKYYYNLNKDIICLRCQYPHFVEICHIIPVSHFNNDDSIDLINDISNLLALCPNCHKELDNNMINDDEIKQLQLLQSKFRKS